MFSQGRSVEHVVKGKRFDCGSVEEYILAKTMYMSPKN